MTPFARVLVVFAASLWLSCGEADPAPAREAPARAASEGARGSGLCKEHGVLESVCTKCNPALVPVFKAKGDWCQEHGFPESFCPICHPERGGQPALALSADDAPADGLKVHFKNRDVARLAGIEVQAAVTRASTSRLQVTAKTVYDATKVAEINPRTVGVVRTVSVDVGASVRRGATLAVIESAEVGAAKARLEAARSRFALAKANDERLSGLHRDGIAAQKDALAAAHEKAAAQAEVTAGESALGMLGGVQSDASYAVTAPLAGVVVARTATVGHLVTTSDVLFQIVDVSSLWAELDIPETALARVRTGQRVEIHLDTFADRPLSGALSYVAPQVDPHTRTVRGRVSLANADNLLRANMFARAEIILDAGEPVLVVPRTALQRAKSAQLVFVRVAEDTFEVRRVQTGEGDADWVEVRGRLAAGDLVATTGSFLLKTETLKGSIGAGCCDVEGP